MLLSGFEGRNHDHSLHSVTFGPDGKWYFNQGNTGAWFTDRSGRTFRIGSHYEAGKALGPFTHDMRPIEYAGQKSDDGHVYVGGTAMRMNPDGTNVEPIGFNFRNSYEQTVTSFGDVFHNDNDDPPAARTSFLQEYGNMGFNSRDGKRGWAADRRPGQNTSVAEWRQDDPGTVPAGDVYGNDATTGIEFYEGDAQGEKCRGALLSWRLAQRGLRLFPKPDRRRLQARAVQFLTTNPKRDFAGIDSSRGRLRAGDSKRGSARPMSPSVPMARSMSPTGSTAHGRPRRARQQVAGAIYRITPRAKSSDAEIDVSTTAGQIAALKSPR